VLYIHSCVENTSAVFTFFIYPLLSMICSTFPSFIV
jgi:hypothetical protein